MKKSAWTILLLAILLTSFSCGKKADDSKEVAEDQNEEKFEDTKIEKDTEFAVAAADAGLLEVQLGQLAQTNGSDAQVKAFAQTMIDEHTKVGEELKTAATQKNITLPSSLSDDAKKKYDKLAEKQGADFDKDYIDAMVDGHKDVISKFEKEAEKGDDADLKLWASEKLPALKHHLEMAEQTKSALKEKH